MSSEARTDSLPAKVLPKAIRFSPWWLLAVLSLLVAVGLYWSNAEDARLLREQALRVTAGLVTSEAKIEALNDWVYHNQGFAKNPHYFWSQKLGPTPRQVFEAGGDCADKSRLLSTMLGEVGIDSSLAMQYPCPDCDPVHTVVYAETGHGVTVADPVYDIVFPDGKGGLLPVAALVQDDKALHSRLTELRDLRGSTDKIAFYEEKTHHFRYATTINWNKNELLRTVARALTALDIEPRRLFRPAILENPKQALAAAAMMASVFCAVVAGYVRRKT
jgi:hypothetical protein